MMKKLFICLMLGLVSCGLYAQRPNMHLKAKVGIQGLNYIYKVDSLDSEYFAGVHGGFGFRVIRKKAMGEIGFDFIRYWITLPDTAVGDIEFKLNSFELPITVGYATYQKPFFKHFVYGGIVTDFKIKSEITIADSVLDDPIRLRPKETLFISPTFQMRLGTQVDIGMFNFDFNYSLGLSKAFKAIVRTQSHSVRFSMGIIF